METEYTMDRADDPLSPPREVAMILRYAALHRHPAIFLSMTGLRVREFDALLRDVRPLFAEAEHKRLSRPDRQRAIGAGHPHELSVGDQLLLTVVWLRQYPTHEVLGYLFGVSDSAVSRTLPRWLPVLEAAGRDTMRLPDPGKKKRRSLETLLADTPQLAVIIDTFEQRVQRPTERPAADKHYSGQKKMHTLKSQVAVEADTGRIVDVYPGVLGPTADLTVLDESKLLARLPKDVGALGDLAYVGLDKRHPQGLGATPRRKPRGQDRPAEDIAYNRAFARRRIRVEHGIGRMRRYQCLSQMDRHHQRHYSERVYAVAGLANRQMTHRLPA